MPTAEPSIPSVWARPQRKKEQPTLSRPRIVDEAVRLLDAQGIEALSMRSLGAQLGAGATSLYRHVANKDELIELVVDQVYGELQVPHITETGQWQAAITTAAGSLRSMALRHPWVVSVLGQVGLAYLGPNLARQSERILDIFATAGFDATESDYAMSTVIAYVIGMVTSEVAWLNLVARSGQTEQEWARTLWPAAEQAAQEHPRMRDGYQNNRNADPAVIRQDKFDYGLRRILHGLAGDRD